GCGVGGCCGVFWVWVWGSGEGRAGTRTRRMGTTPKFGSVRVAALMASADFDMVESKACRVALPIWLLQPLTWNSRAKLSIPTSSRRRGEAALAQPLANNTWPAFLTRALYLHDVLHRSWWI